MIMKKFYYLFAAAVSVALASCTNEALVEQGPGTQEEISEAINFNFNLQNMTRAGEFVGATAAEKLGGMFVVEGTKGEEETNSPSTSVVFDNYLVGYSVNTAGTTESNTNNWEYVGLQSGITDRMTAATWTALHPAVKAQSVKYWDYTQDQYDFIAWSTGTCEAVTTAAEDGKVKVTRINTGTTLKTNGFTLSAANATDLLQCYYTDINTVTKASGNYGKPVTLTFRNMAAKVRVALYETVPGYSIKNVMFYPAEADDPTAPTDLGTNSGLSATATLFTTDGTLPQSGDVLVYYPRIGKTNRDATPKPVDYNKASVTVTAGSSTSTKQAFGALTNQYGAAEANEPAGNIYLGRTLPNATYAGAAADNYYTAVIPNTNGKPLTLRVDYTLVSTDGSEEEIHIYGAKAVVPSTYTVWQPNYAYTYIFKISDNTNGWTSQTNTDPKGLFPITFDAVVTNFVDYNDEQTTITTVATPSITTYQQGHDTSNDEYSKSQTAGVSTAVKAVYVQVMDNSAATPSLVGDLNGSKKSRLYKITKGGANYVASEAEVMDALQNRINTISADDPEGRNGILLTKNGNIDNTVTSIVNGVDDQPITKIAGAAISKGQVAEIDIEQLDPGTYAYVYSTTVPTKDEKVYNVVKASATDYDYYEVALTGTETPLGTGATAAAGKVYFVKNVDATGAFVSYTFKQTKVGDNVEGLVEATIPTNKATSYTAGNFYFDVYNRNNGAYAVKVIKVVD